MKMKIVEKKNRPKFYASAYAMQPSIIAPFPDLRRKEKVMRKRRGIENEVSWLE
jgi:hypothetical protein